MGKKPSKSYVIYEITDNGNLKFVKTQLGVRETCKEIKNYPANLDSFLKKKINKLGKYIVVCGQENTFETLVEANARLNRQKLMFQQLTVKKINELSDEQVEKIVRILNEIRN